MGTPAATEHRGLVEALSALADTVGRARREMLRHGRTPQHVEIPSWLVTEYQEACLALYGHELEWFFQLPVRAAGLESNGDVRVL